MNFFESHDITLGKALRIASIFFIVSLIVFYVQFQARNIIQGPALTITNTLPSIQHERRITINGTAHNVVKLTLNGKEIHTDEDGAFSHTLVLENSYTIMSLNAQDRFGRTTSLIKEFVYVPS
ncbi:MAG: hypothetical protein WAW13_04570 [Minisyncoccia bacterium]